MKKIVLLVISIMMVSATFAQMTNPIPSYNVLVSSGTSFQERGTPDTPACVFGGSDSSKDKRDMNVSNEGSAGNGNGPQGQGIVGPDVVVYIYKAGGDHNILGPFVISAGTTLTVSIDHSKNWGVHVISNSIAYMSVWTNDKP